MKNLGEVPSSEAEVSKGVNLFKKLAHHLVHGEKEFEDQLYTHLNNLDEAQNDRVDITRYPTAVQEFVEYISGNYYFFKVFADETTKAQFYEILEI